MRAPRKMRLPFDPSHWSLALQMSLSPEAIATLSRVSTGTITTVLLNKGLRNVWMRGTKPLRPGQPRLVGPAFTLRFVPAREDLATPASWSSPISTRTAIEAMPKGCIAVVDAMGVTDAGIFGDILCARMVKRGVAALGHRRRGARRRGRARHQSAGVVRRFCRAAFGRGPDLSSAGANRSAAAGLRYFRTTSSSPTRTARC